MKTVQQPLIFPSMPGILRTRHQELDKYLVKTKSSREINIVYFGTPEFSAYILKKLIEFCQTPKPHVHLGGVHREATKFVIQAVVTSPDKPVGRIQLLTQSLVSLVATKYSIPTLKPNNLDEDFIENHLSLLDCDLFIVASFGKILPVNLLDIPRLGSLNVHPSLLPKYRGASPIQTAILNGDKTTGVSIIAMDNKIDHGPILAEKEVEIESDDTTESLRIKLAQLATPLLMDSMEKFVSGIVKPRVQNHAQASFCTQIKKEDGYFDINNPPSKEVLDRMIRAYYPWPNVWTRWNNKIVKFYPDNFVQMEGKNKVKLSEFLNGYPEFPLKSLFTVAVKM